MADFGIWDVTLGILTIASIIIGFVNETYRLFAWIGAVFIVFLAIELKNSTELINLKSEHKKQHEQISIYKELIDIKSDIKLLKEVQTKMGKKGQVPTRELLEVARILLILLVLYIIYKAVMAEIGAN